MAGPERCGALSGFGVRSSLFLALWNWARLLGSSLELVCVFVPALADREGVCDEPARMPHPRRGAGTASPEQADEAASRAHGIAARMKMTHPISGVDNVHRHLFGAQVGPHRQNQHLDFKRIALRAAREVGRNGQRIDAQAGLGIAETLATEDPRPKLDVADLHESATAHVAYRARPNTALALCNRK